VSAPPRSTPWPRRGATTRRAQAAACALAFALAGSLALADDYGDFDDEDFEEIFGPGDDLPEAGATEPVAPEPVPDPELPIGELAPAAQPPPEASDERRGLKLQGYIQPALGVRYRPDGVPRDQWQFGADATRIGVELGGSPIEGWFYNLHLVIGGEILSPLIDVAVVDRVGDGSPNDIDATFQHTPGIGFEEAIIGYALGDAANVKLGQMRIPFTVQHQSPNTSLMFPQRSGPNEVFLKGRDIGALASAGFGHLKASAGVFNGTGTTPFAGAPIDPSCGCNRVVRGMMYAGRIDVSPLGEFPLGVRARSDQPLRVGVGAGVLYFPFSTFDNSGFSNARVRDLRASASLRLAAAGLTAQAEVLRRQQTDSLSFRPIIATGGYGQLSYYVPLTSDFGFAPIARWGATLEDQSFDARTTYWTEAGLTLYVHPDTGNPRDEVRVTIHYLDERRITEGENAHGLIAQLQVLW
jgi:hypothetical protein